jgi:predicted transcriptional regulator
MVMKKAKDEVRKLLKNIPDASTFEDIQYHIYVRAKIEKGLRAARQGQVVMHDEVKKRLKKWLTE